MSGSDNSRSPRVAMLAAVFLATGTLAASLAWVGMNYTDPVRRHGGVDVADATMSGPNSDGKNLAGNSTSMVAGVVDGAPPSSGRIRLAQNPQLPPAESPRSVDVADVYQDALIDPGTATDAPYDAASGARGTTALPGAAAAEYRYFNQRTSGDVSNKYTENGIAVEARQETGHYGRIEARAIYTSAENDGLFSNAFDGGQYANITQRDFALTDRWLMTNELGDQRAHVPNLLSQGYRIRLPEPTIRGASSELRSGDTSIRATGGTLGVLQGRTFPVFTTDFSSGSLAGASANTRINPHWQASAQFFQMSDAATALGKEDFSSTAGTVRYDGEEQSSFQASFLANDSGPTGYWFDGEARAGALLNHLGYYHMDRDLAWIDRNNTVLSDVQGIYWRGDTRSFRTTSSIGAEWSQSNVDHDNAVPTRTSTYAFGNRTYQWSPVVDLGGFLSVGRDEVEGGGIDTRNTTTNVRGTLTSRFEIGTSSWMLGLLSTTGSDLRTRYEGSWDHYWLPVGRVTGLRTGIAYYQQSNNDVDQTEWTVRGGGGWNTGSVQAALNLNVGYLSGDVIESGRTATATAHLGWSIAQDWHASADLTYNHNALQVANGIETRVTDRQILLSLRYDTAWGREQFPLGALNGKYGRGAIRGVLFYDKNGNGVRDPGEEGVRNILIELDRGVSVATNDLGEFSFNPVASGDHRISVNVANIPLPWSLDERRPILARVEPRQTAIVEIPLIRFGPN